MPRRSEAEYVLTEALKKLRGGKIVGGYIERDGDGEWALEFPVLIVEKRGKKHDVIVQADSEGNSSGWLAIYDHEEG
jgi:hypothetical protein